MPRRQRREQKLFLENLPDEVLLRIYGFWVLQDSNICIATKTYDGNQRGRKYKFSVVSKRYNRVTSNAKHTVYEEALIKHVLHDSETITANIKDLSFANLKPFLALLKEHHQLPLFQENPAAHPARTISLHHIITEDFPQEPAKLLDFGAWVGSKLYDSPKPSLYTDNHIVQKVGSEVTESFFRQIQLLFAGDEDLGETTVISRVVMIIEGYVKMEHARAMQRKNQQRLAREQMVREYYGVEENVEE